MKHPYTVVFFGKSGSGKGTQASLLLKTLERVDPDNKALYVETGKQFREFANSSDSYLAKRVMDVMQAGKFMPPFLPIWTWTQYFADHLKTGGEHMVCDGLCRQPEEAPILDQAFQFLNRNKPTIILDVHHTIVTDRLLKRGRFDDQPDKIAERLRSFDSQAVPSIHYFKKSPHVKFVTINGDQTIEKVHEDVLKALGIEGRL